MHQSHWILITHGKWIVGSEKDVICPESPDQIAECLRVVDDRVHIDRLQIAARRTVDSIRRCPRDLMKGLIEPTRLERDKPVRADVPIDITASRTIPVTHQMIA